MCFFMSSRRRHTRCALVTGVQTCALPISLFVALPACHRLARQRPLSWPDLATLRLHVRAREGEVRHFGSLLGLCAHLRDYEEHDVSSAALLDMVSIGMGATIVAKSASLARPGVVYRPIPGATRSDGRRVGKGWVGTCV